MTKSSPSPRKSKSETPKKRLKLSDSSPRTERRENKRPAVRRPGAGFHGKDSAPRRPSSSGPRKKLTLSEPTSGAELRPVRRSASSASADRPRSGPARFGSRPGAKPRTSRDGARPTRSFSRSEERPALRRGPARSSEKPHAFAFKIKKERPEAPARSLRPALKNKVLTTSAPAKETVRLNRFIASAGITARRKADDLITRGKVTVNGKIVRELGVQVNPNKDQVTVDGKTISMKTRFVYLLLNKPKDTITTVKDETDRNTVMNYVSTHERVYPVGRLDRNTTGVLLLTNDGDLTARLTHPKYEIKREYHVTLDKPLKKEDAQRIATGGIDLGDGDTSPAVHLAYAERDPKDIYLTLKEGKYREVRRLFEVTGYDVRKLDRIMFAGITHRGMKRGESRVLTPREVRDLKKSVGLDVGSKFDF
ncbi:MAG: pseudouridine synthase [Bacteroidota bacterium]|nr:pseudouridine synthase [Bacteroidota bacterium]MDP4230344.1 pseudouridine synthase [Bacteroidota bacterium]MDP4235243.1 pseudouridine synthase [Bacteroidota bacterium]